jgi:IS5 family transposase
MPRQTSFADLDNNHKKRRTRREVFLSEMEGVIPWQELLSHIEPHYPKNGQRGRQPMVLSNMFRIYCLQNWFNLSDRQMEDALYEIKSMRCFAGFSGVTGYPAGRDHDTEFPASFREARIDGGIP